MGPDERATPLEGEPRGRAPDPDAGAPAPDRKRRTGLFVLAFGSGFAVLAIEIAGARMIAPVFGLSAVPWTAVIGVILAALAVGSHLGGRLADQADVPLASVLVAAGATGVLPVVGAAVPWALRDALGFVPGAVASALVLFAPSVLCLGAVVPYLVKADTESLGSVGRRAGDLSAAATAGSIAGSFTTGFVLLPAFPLPVLMAGTAGSLLLLAWLSGRLLGGARASGATLAVVALGLGGAAWAAAAPVPGVLHRAQTLYAAVQVTERTWSDGRVVRELWQNGGSSSAEYVDDGTPAHDYVTVSEEVLRPRLADARSMLVLGGAALSLPVRFTELAPSLRVDVVEIDPVVTDLAFRYFTAGREPRPRIRVVHEDARVHLRRSEARYDIVYLDVFDHLLTVPWTLVTREAMRSMADRLAPGGLFAANVLSPLDGPGATFLARLRATVEEVFPATRIFLVDPGADGRVTQNLIVVGALDEGTLDSVAPPGSGRPTARVRAEGRPFTDAWAPVEYLQAKVFFQGLGW